MATDSEPGTSQWQQLSAVIDGRPLAVGTGVRLDVSATGYALSVNGRTIQQGTAANRTDTSPAQTDVLVTQGRGAGRRVEQIYRIDGDVMIACAAPPGAPRPTEFACPPGSGRSLSVWLRVRETERPLGPPTLRDWLCIAGCVVVATVCGAAQENLASAVGAWAGIAAGSLSIAAIVAAVFVYWKRDLSDAVVLGVMCAISLTIFEQLELAIAPALGKLGAIFVAGSTAFVASLLLATLLGRLKSARWV